METIKAVLTICALFALLVLSQSAYADMGQIHASPAMVSETAQKAIILHNGEEEVLILGTDLQADRNAGVIRFIPFPSEPQVGLAPAGAFEAASELLKKHKLQMVFFSKGGPAEGRPVDILLEKKLGAHDMTVIKVNDPLQFRKWANDYFSKKNLPVLEEYATAEAIVGDYVGRGIVYFVLDFVEVSGDTRFIEPVAYRFESKELYYPLKTSNTFGGNGAIDMILVVPGTLCDPMHSGFTTCLGSHDIQGSTSAAVAAAELSGIYPDAERFFGDEQLFIQMARFWGVYDFDKDIFADITKAVPKALEYVPDEGPSRLDILAGLVEEPGVDVTNAPASPPTIEPFNGDLSCKEMYDEIERDIDKANYCNEDSDCDTLMLGGWYVDFGCYHFVNMEVDKSLFYQKMDVYKEKCSQVINDCSPAPEASCVSKKCVYVAK